MHARQPLQLDIQLILYIVQQRKQGKINKGKGKGKNKYSAYFHLRTLATKHSSQCNSSLAIVFPQSSTQPRRTYTRKIVDLNNSIERSLDGGWNIRPEKKAKSWFFRDLSHEDSLKMRYAVLYPNAKKHAQKDLGTLDFKNLRTLVLNILNNGHSAFT